MELTFIQVFTYYRLETRTKSNYETFFNGMKKSIFKMKMIKCFFAPSLDLGHHHLGFTDLTPLFQDGSM